MRMIAAEYDPFNTYSLVNDEIPFYGLIGAKIQNKRFVSVRDVDINNTTLVWNAFIDIYHMEFWAFIDG